jgi:hypothetical protein
MIPKMEERDEVENSDAVDTRSDQSGSDEKKFQPRLPHQPRPFRGLTTFLHIFFDLQVTVASKFHCQLQTLHFYG